MLLRILRDLLMVSSAPWIVSRALVIPGCRCRSCRMDTPSSSVSSSARDALADAVGRLIQRCELPRHPLALAQARGRVHVVQLGAGERCARSLRALDATPSPLSPRRALSASSVLYS